MANVYNLSSRLYQFKLAGQDQKRFLLIESGTRIHTTEFEREKDRIPSNFALKLRKHVRTKRLDDVRQLGDDRIIDLKFGTGTAANHIILELFAAGNIILTDEK